MLRLKICCIQDEGEAALAVRYGAFAVGLVSRMPSGPGVIPEKRIARIAAAVPRHVKTVLLTSLRSPGAIVAQHRRCGTDAIQVCDRLQRGSLADLRESLPGVWLIQVIHVNGTEALEEASTVATRVDALLLDSGSPSGDVKELGGTGRTHDWNTSRSVVRGVKAPVFLAGGLRPGNVTEAIHRVRPFGIDVCTGVRSEGRLDETKLAAFVSAVREAEDRI